MPILYTNRQKSHQTPATNTGFQGSVILHVCVSSTLFHIKVSPEPRPAQAVKLRRPAHLQPRAVPHARHGRYRLFRAERVDRARRARLVADVTLEGAGGAGRAIVNNLAWDYVYYCRKNPKLGKVQRLSAYWQHNEHILSCCYTGKRLGC